jgi:large subunit ribosomal protein L19
LSGKILSIESEFAAMATNLIKAVEGKANARVPELKSGDTVSVHVRIKEGDKERVQGTIIRVRNSGNNANFTVRRTASHGIGVERTFLLRSPRIEKVEVQRHASVRRAQLYYLRDLTGKKARLREKREAVK